VNDKSGQKALSSVRTKNIVIWKRSLLILYCNLMNNYNCTNYELSEAVATAVVAAAVVAPLSLESLLPLTLPR